MSRAVHVPIPFRAVVADSFYGEDRGFRRGLRELKVGFLSLRHLLLTSASVYLLLSSLVNKVAVDHTQAAIGFSASFLDMKRVPCWAP